MAIDLTAFCKLPIDDFDSILNKIRREHPDIFPKQYVLYQAKRVDSDDEELAAEFGYYGIQSYVLISLNDKLTSTLVGSDIADLLRSYLGEENILVLIEETKL